jgi:hypothetical protein
MNGPPDFPKRGTLETSWPGTKVLLSNADGARVKGLADLESDPAGRTSVPEEH